MKGLSSRELLLAVLRRRALVVGLLSAAAVVTGLGVLAPASEHGVPVLVAVRDLGAGAVVGPGDVEVRAVPRRVVPDGARADAPTAVGRTRGGAVRRGELLTDTRRAGAGLLHGLPEGTTATPVRLADAGAAALLAPGDVVDVLAAAAGAQATGEEEAASVVAPSVTVLAVPSAGDATSGGVVDGALVVLATSPATAARLAAAAVHSRLSVSVRSPR